MWRKFSDEECNIAGCPWWRMQSLHSSFECLCIVAFFFCLAKLQNRSPCGGSYSDEECNIAGCLWGRMQGLHSSFGCVCIVAFFFFCPTLRPVPRFLTEGVILNRQKKEKPARKNLPCESEDWQPCGVSFEKDAESASFLEWLCIVAFFHFFPDSSPVNALCRIPLRKGDTYPSDWNQGCNARFEARKKQWFIFAPN